MTEPMEDRRSRSWIPRIVILIGVAIVIAAGVSALRAGEARRLALEEVDRVEALRVEAEARASLLSDSLALEQERSAVVLGHLGEQKERADSMAALLAAETALEASKALETGETLGQTLETARGAAMAPVAELLDTALVQLSDHLEADRRTVEGFGLQIRAMSEARAASEAETMEWQRLAGLADEALTAREAECQLCREELILLKDIKDPGWLERIIDKAGTIVVTAAGTLLLAIVIL